MDISPKKVKAPSSTQVAIVKKVREYMKKNHVTNAEMLKAINEASNDPISESTLKRILKCTSSVDSELLNVLANICGYPCLNQFLGKSCPNDTASEHDDNSEGKYRTFKKENRYRNEPTNNHLQINIKNKPDVGTQKNNRMKFLIHGFIFIMKNDFVHNVLNIYNTLLYLFVSGYLFRLLTLVEYNPMYTTWQATNSLCLLLLIIMIATFLRLFLVNLYPDTSKRRLFLFPITIILKACSSLFNIKLIILESILVSYVFFFLVYIDFLSLKEVAKNRGRIKEKCSVAKCLILR